MKTILITGATDGIGKHLAKTLAKEGHEVIIHGRNSVKLAATLKEIQAVAIGNRVVAYQADFSQMKEVRTFVKEIKRNFKTVDVLINNAGLYAGSTRTTTTENVELTLMLSVLVPYYLTKELVPLLDNSGAGRVINTSSFMHHFANTKELDFGMEKHYNPSLAYNNAKLYTIWLTRYQAQLFEKFGFKITVNAYHPGLIATNLGRDPRDEKGRKSVFKRVMKLLSKNLDEGIETGYYLALSEEVASRSGCYFDNKKVKRVSEKGYSPEKAQQLIDYCERSISLYKEV